MRNGRQFSVVLALLGMTAMTWGAPPPHPAPQPPPAQVAGAAIRVGDKARLNIELADRSKFNIADCRGKIIVIVFWVSSDMDKAEMPKFIDIKAKYADKGLVMVGLNGDKDVELMQGTVQQLGLNFPQHWNGSWRQNKVFADWGIGGLPRAAIVGPDLTVLYVGFVGQINAEVEKAFLNHPPQIVDADELAAAAKLVKDGRAALTSGDVLAAYKDYAAITPNAKKDPVVGKGAGDLRYDLIHSADKAFPIIDEMIAEKKYVEAAMALKSMLPAVGGMNSEADVNKRLNDLMAQPDVRLQVETAEHNAAAAEALAAARKLRDSGDDEAAYGRFKAIVMDYADTPAAADAAAAVKTYDADPTFQKKMRENAVAVKALAALNLADNYYRSHRDDLAKQKYQDVIDQYPDTKFADQAAKALADLK